ncbi:GerMN domain-containing protein [Anaerobacillus sp. CMMVII]|uniref:Gmad2 immunoglobulin-like domain-containing protein n=1 Tax=Anaerobacillus sp. CMMVII TaxID=2755588 RepID=UPI0021B8226A|nr:Gmad2 immunoglobulin-like domain-containing protein [Anaerobacillus sp. CMMVII]MCT8139207.1 GerMN domain-containing protein [Anaerobacillus sp. CMMVII]
MKKLISYLLITLLSSLLLLSACVQEIPAPDPDVKDPVEENPGQDSDNVPEPEVEEPIDEGNLSPTPEEKYEAHQIVLYFSDNDLMGTYRVEKEIVVREGDQIEKAALEAWLKGPDHDELMGLINSKVIIEYIENFGGVAHVSFSKEITELNLGSSGELLFAEQLAMLMQQFGFEQTQILVEGRVGESLLGHLYTGEPIAANDPESYLWVDEKISREIVLQNVAFRIFEPSPGAEVKDRIVVRGLARVYEGTIMYEFEDGHFILAEGFTTASEGAPGWGEFEIIIELDEVSKYSGTVILYEESANDGSRRHELKIPVKVK